MKESSDELKSKMPELIWNSNESAIFHSDWFGCSWILYFLHWNDLFLNTGGCLSANNSRNNRQKTVFQCFIHSFLIWCLQFHPRNSCFIREVSTRAVDNEVPLIWKAVWVWLTQVQSQAESWGRSVGMAEPLNLEIVLQLLFKFKTFSRGANHVGLTIYFPISVRYWPLTHFQKKT